MQTVVILAGSYSEGRKAAAVMGFGNRAIVPVDAQRLLGLRPTAILELPSFTERRDRHAFDSVLQPRYSVVPRMLLEPADFRPPVTESDEPGQTTIDEQIALAEVDRIARLEAIETAGHSSAQQVAADAPAPTSETPPSTGYKPRSRARTKRST
jgi:hypothetical protein